MGPSTIVVASDDLATVIDPESLGLVNAREGDIDPTEHATIIEKATPSTAVEEEPHDLAMVVDPPGVSPREGGIDRRKSPSVIEKTVRPAAIIVESHDSATVVDPGGLGFGDTREGDVDRGEGIRGSVDRCGVVLGYA